MAHTHDQLAGAFNGLNIEAQHTQQIRDEAYMIAEAVQLVQRALRVQHSDLLSPEAIDTGSASLQQNAGSEYQGYIGRSAITSDAQAGPGQYPNAA